MTEPSPTLTAADHAGVRFPPPVLHLAGLGLGFLLQALLPLDFVPRAAGVVLAPLGFGSGVALCAWAIGLFRRARTSLVPVAPSNALVVEGPYRFTRNPMYLGLALVYTGLALWFGLGWSLLLLPLVLALNYYLVIAPEERYLERRFGEAYRRYKTQVRRWL